MFARLPLKTAFGAAALAAAGLMLTPAAASAQAYSYPSTHQAYGSYNNGYGQQSGYGYQQPSGYGYDQSYGRSGYDTCSNDRRQRQGTGVAVGATVGAVIGSQLGARGRRTEGSVLGAVIGGALGAAVGNDSARACNDGYGQSQYGSNGYSYSDQSRSGYGYDDRNYSDQSRYGYDDRGYSSQTYRGQSGYQDRGYYDDRDYGYQTNARSRSDCRTVAVRSRDAYGRSVVRYQQSC